MVIIQKKPPMICKSRVGQLTGLEPSTLESRVYPDETTYQDRPVEGFYLLKSNEDLPHLDRMFSVMSPRPLEDDCVTYYE